MKYFARNWKSLWAIKDLGVVWGRQYCPYCGFLVVLVATFMFIYCYTVYTNTLMFTYHLYLYRWHDVVHQTQKLLRKKTDRPIGIMAVAYERYENQIEAAEDDLSLGSDDDPYASNEPPQTAAAMRQQMLVPRTSTSSVKSSVLRRLCLTGETFAGAWSAVQLAKPVDVPAPAT